MPDTSADQPRPEADPDLAITRGLGNVFADLGLPDAADRQLKVDLALRLNALIARRRLTQTAAAERLGVSQPKSA